jgi:predicted phosphodiesterase
MSDIHLEFNKANILKKPYFKPMASVLIVAGDVGYPTSHIFDDFFKFASNNWENVIYVSGNHEYYNVNSSSNPHNKNTIDQMIKKIIDKYSNVHWLDNSSIIIDNIEYIGSTLWSHPIKEDGLNDFMAIYHNDRPLSRDIMRLWNGEAIRAITKLIDTNNNNDVTHKCVVTHFMPMQNKDIPNSIYGCDPILDSYFGNKLYELIKKVDVWISGHTHQPFQFTPDGTQTLCLCHPYGYPYEANGNTALFHNYNKK